MGAASVHLEADAQKPQEQERNGGGDASSSTSCGSSAGLPPTPSGGRTLPPSALGRGLAQQPLALLGQRLNEATLPDAATLPPSPRSSKLLACPSYEHGPPSSLSGLQLSHGGLQKVACDEQACSEPSTQAQLDLSREMQFLRWAVEEQEAKVEALREAARREWAGLRESLSKEVRELVAASQRGLRDALRAEASAWRAELDAQLSGGSSASSEGTATCVSRRSMEPAAPLLHSGLEDAHRQENLQKLCLANLRQGQGLPPPAEGSALSLLLPDHAQPDLDLAADFETRIQLCEEAMFNETGMRQEREREMCQRLDSLEKAVSLLKSRSADPPLVDRPEGSSSDAMPRVEAMYETVRDIMASMDLERQVRQAAIVKVQLDEREQQSARVIERQALERDLRTLAIRVAKLEASSAAGQKGRVVQPLRGLSQGRQQLPPARSSSARQPHPGEAAATL
eukprot:TRINITY_DN113143_c0_g1_i1.p1 TRINITY_DN113143_c0_g1~~TRINITY_DN113143_c0_g1_i1.p1  ORF type:complete len:455 (+),score=136.52 TRINITY_DN113143_c0_g1_i1:159-1523(+)